MTASSQASQASPEAQPAIAVSHLTKRYGKSRGIEDVSFDVRAGEIFGFIGPNGAGKSTTIRTLLGLIRKTSGDARILGLDITRDHVEIMRHVGYLPSEVFYYDGMRARDLFRYAASFYPGDHTLRIKELTERLELDPSMKIEDMSLGNRKKVGIIQGLLHNPEVIILDEPTSGLDPLMQRNFFDLIREEAHRGATVLFSSHILAEVQRICDRVAIIREGRLVAVRSIDELRKSAVKRVTLSIADDGSTVPAAGYWAHRLAAAPGVRNADDADGKVSFLYDRGANQLIELLGGLDLADVEIAEPSLEEVFMHYYTGAEGETTPIAATSVAQTEQAAS